MKTIVLWLIGMVVRQGWVSRREIEALFSDEAHTASRWASAKLALAGTVTGKPEEGLDLLDFFRTKEGIYVWDSFTDRVLKYVTGTVEKIAPVAADYFDLQEALLNWRIRSELPQGHVFGLVEGLTFIAWLIFRQWGGKDGVLLSNGCTNLFYLDVNSEVLVVYVYWGAGHGRWGVGVWALGESGLWSAGHRVFSRKA